MAKILLVEDDNNLREIYEARLQAEGYTIVSAQDGEEALVVAKAEKPDLIISDVMMPKISGFEMLDILRNTDGLQHVKVIMLTALGQSDDQQRASKLGADRYLVKSQVTLEDIVKSAHDLLADEAASEPAVPGASSEPTPVTAAPAPSTSTPSPTPTTAPPVPPATSPAPEPPAPAEPAQAAPEPAPSAQPPSPAPSSPASAPVSQAVAATPAPEPPAEPASATPKSAPADDTKAADDKLMDDAVNALIAETEKQKTGATPGDTVNPEPKTESSEAKEAKKEAEATVPEDSQADDGKKPQIKTESSAQNKQAAADSSSKKDDSDETSSHVPVAHKKVIKPLEGEPKKDINELLALEEAKEAGTANPPASDNTTQPSDSASDEEKEKDEKTAKDALAAAKDASSASEEEAGIEAKIEDFVAGATTEPNQPSQPPSTASAQTDGEDEKESQGQTAEPPSAPAAESSQAASASDKPATTEQPNQEQTPAPQASPSSDEDAAKDSPDPNTIAL